MMHIGFIGKNYESSIVISSLLSQNNEIFINVLEEEYSKITSDKVAFFKQTNNLISNSTILVIATKDYKKFLEEYEDFIFEKLLIFIDYNVEVSEILKYTSLFTIVLPNVGTISNKGYSLICKNSYIDFYLQEIIEQECINIFKFLGKIKVINYDDMLIYNELVNNSVLYFSDILKNMSKYFINKDIDKTIVRELLANSMEIAALKVILYDESSLEKLVKSNYFYNEKTEKAIKYIDDMELENIYNPKKLFYEIKYEYDK